MTQDEVIKIVSFCMPCHHLNIDMCLNESSQDAKLLFKVHKSLSLQPHNSKRVNINSIGCNLYFLINGQEAFKGSIIINYSASFENPVKIIIPYICPDDLMRLMINCLSGDSLNRPTIDNILSYKSLKKKYP